MGSDMTQISQIQTPISTSPVISPGTPQADRASRGTDPQSDRVEFSELSQFLNTINDLPEIRVDKVAAAKLAIERGDFDADSVLDQTVDRLLEDL
jgi:anti-sigma28 factor (negative regulator of flagellin synthesis)